MTRNILLAGLASLAVMAFALPAEAATVEFTDAYFVAIDDAQAPGAEYSGPTADAATSEAVLAPEDLADLAGQGDGPVGVLTEQTLTALNTGNTIVGANVSSGVISIDQNAFNGFDGIGNFVINSGHNNTLKSSLSVSIVIAH